MALTWSAEEKLLCRFGTLLALTFIAIKYNLTATEWQDYPFRFPKTNSDEDASRTTTSTTDENPRKKQDSQP
jgi:hypothetical protein